MFAFILSANVTEMISTPENKRKLGIIPRQFDLDEFSEEEHLQICVKGVETVPQLSIQIIENTKPSPSKYWTVRSTTERSRELTVKDTKRSTYLFFERIIFIDKINIGMIIILPYTLEFLDLGSH